LSLPVVSSRHEAAACCSAHATALISPALLSSLQRYLSTTAPSPHPVSCHLLDTQSDTDPAQYSCIHIASQSFTMSAHPTVLSSPTFSAATNSSFDLVSLSEACLTPSSSEDSDDEIVWSVSSASASAASKGSFLPASEDDDYVVLNRGSSPIRGSASPAVDPHTPHPDDLVISMNNLSMSDREQSQHNKPRRHRSKQASPVLKQRRKGNRSAESPQPSSRKALVAKPIHTGLGSRPVVDDLSETLDSVSISDEESVVSTMYEEAVNYINS
jgi:hypothetical protein